MVVAMVVVEDLVEAVTAILPVLEASLPGGRRSSPP